MVGDVLGSFVTPVHCQGSAAAEILNFLSLASLLWDIGKQNSPRCDAAERRPIWGYSVCLENFHRKIEWNSKITLDDPKNESGLTQMIMMGKIIYEELGIHTIPSCTKDRDNGELNFNNYTYFSRRIKPTIRLVPSSMK